MTNLHNIPSTKKDLEDFLLYSIDFLKDKPATRSIIDGPVLYVGDVHGFFENVKNAVKIGMKKSVSDIVFLGDYSDRGPEQTRTLISVIFLQIARDANYKQFKFIDPIFYKTGHINFTALRGNHEDIKINQRYGFKNELYHYYGYFPKEILEDLYNHLPIFVETDWNSFALHGGIPKAKGNHSILEFLNKARKLILPLYKNSSDLLDIFIADMIFQLMWNDPNDTDSVKKPQFYPSFRGDNIYTFNEEAFNDFLKETGYKRMIRSHESFRGAYQEIWGGKIINIFSAYPYFNQISSMAYFLENRDGLGEILNHEGKSIHSVKKINV